MSTVKEMKHRTDVGDEIRLFPGYIPPIVTLEQIKHRILRAQERVLRGQREVEVWREVLDMEQGPTPKAATGSVQSIRPEPPVPLTGIACLRTFLQFRPEGVTYPEMNAHLKENGIRLSPNFAYNMVSKWGGQVAKREGKLFWVGSSSSTRLVAKKAA